MSRLGETREIAEQVIPRLTQRQRDELVRLALRLAATDGGGALLSPAYQKMTIRVVRDIAPTMSHELAALLSIGQLIISTLQQEESTGEPLAE